MHEYRDSCAVEPNSVPKLKFVPPLKSKVIFIFTLCLHHHHLILLASRLTPRLLVKKTRKYSWWVMIVKHMIYVATLFDLIIFPIGLKFDLATHDVTNYPHG